MDDDDWMFLYDLFFFTAIGVSAGLFIGLIIYIATHP